MIRAWLRARRQLAIAKACADLAFQYQAYLASRVIIGFMKGDVDYKLVWRQKFWLRSSLRYHAIARGERPFTHSRPNL